MILNQLHTIAKKFQVVSLSLSIVYFDQIHGKSMDKLYSTYIYLYKKGSSEIQDVTNIFKNIANQDNSADTKQVIYIKQAGGNNTISRYVDGCSQKKLDCCSTSPNDSEIWIGNLKPHKKRGCKPTNIILHSQIPYGPSGDLIQGYKQKLLIPVRQDPFNEKNAKK